MAVILCIYYICENMGLSLGEMASRIGEHHTTKMFFFDDPKDGGYFWKQFLAGIFMAIATNGLDQDMMQRSLASKTSKESQKNMMISGVMLFFVITLFLILGTALVIFLEFKGIPLPQKTDELFGMVASHSEMPLFVGIMFIVGLIAAAYSAAGSALTSLTTSFTVDILDGQKKYEDKKLTKVRKGVHVCMSVLMGLVIIGFYYISDQDAISAVYTVASYTYGPLLGLFCFGLFSRRPVHDYLVPLVCVAAPILSWVIQDILMRVFEYETSFELLILNALLTMGGLLAVSKKIHASEVTSGQNNG